MSGQHYLLGIDAGGTKTVALVAGPAGELLGRGGAGPANLHANGHAAAEAALAQAAGAACTEAGVTLAEIAGVCIGLAGVDRPHERAHFQAWAAAHFPGTAVVIANDAELVLAAGTPEGWGVALICGTGSIVYGRRTDGHLARAGGWGHLLGDEGSGYAIGLAGLRAVLRAYDGRTPPTALTAPVLAHWQLASPPDFLHRVYQAHASKAEIAALAPLVLAAAADGDAAASHILEEAADELALAVAAVAQRLAVADTLPCAVAGGVMLGSPQLQAQFGDAARRRGLTLAPITNVAEPVYGALRLAQRAAA